jgi:hypothetical protein
MGVMWKDGGATLEADAAASSLDGLVVACVALGAFADQAYPVAGTSLVTVRSEERTALRRRRRHSAAADGGAGGDTHLPHAERCTGAAGGVRPAGQQRRCLPHAGATDVAVWGGGQAVRAGMAAIGEAAAALVAGACAADAERKSIELPALVGVVWEKCQAVERLPRDNRAAVGRALAKAAVQIKDVVREMDEIDTDAAAGKAGDGDGDGDSDEDDDDDDLDFDVEFGAYTNQGHAPCAVYRYMHHINAADGACCAEAEELKVLVSAKPVFATAMALLRSSVRVLAEGEARQPCGLHAPSTRRLRRLTVTGEARCGLVS